ncbi:glycerol-1-phosphate dehydrogenase [NAD(P)+] [Halobacillus karajensis]|uniref:Glycerol-1-phosphate dehydrogenase [NAD(P)+] n=1 Tax=Halobacillus karajensis TaxID=195088 RepID=A0A024P9X0_9BACI|nr:sn-glycerol-1-phosphate dehydrogenase [Halobacillus karajensis]CDQ20130.1 Glycerol-1-phosphate dehydrogenase [NAD(P)+] [Halobacillus karajensis]CDQ25207.1 Glycerol-1-phosphate dehydrogenase [NAD(P)+] [Halobacillus karajensis]CDQ28432.1 Glycerol-1-phosphate dehydrogenase [NAD(P)+] [Halobacillus karajensis]SEI01013.1 glycerol-1-phosphate dehydrogenase [NAD(P)+] [Halobacillus karajensis]
MNDLQEMKQLAFELEEDPDKVLPYINIDKGSIEALPEYLNHRGFKHVALIADQHTWKAAGKKIATILEQGGYEVAPVQITPNTNGQVLADEPSIVQVLVETPPRVDVLLAIGSGTIHDITRFCSSKMGAPFISVPTAASVDGFTSKGAPLILRGFKQTIQTVSPIAVFADIDILKEAPLEMTAAGFGDMIAKMTSLLDWKISHWVNDEPYNETAANLTRRSLYNCVDHVNEIAKADEEGIRILIKALIESGLVMLLLDFSRPASGGEHHLSHYWEMDLLKKGAPQVLHGAKVGVATAILIQLYQFYAEDESVFGAHTPRIAEEISRLPDYVDVLDWLQLTGGAQVPSDLGIDSALVHESLNKAFTIRDRCTGLYLINQAKTEDLSISWRSDHEL